MTGSDKIRVDDKGRLAFPSRFRDCLQSGGNWYLTGHPHGCLALYSEARFQKIVKHFEESPNMSYFDSHLEEVIVGSAEFMQLDSAGRILIPNHLRERAVIKRDVLLFVMSGGCAFGMRSAGSKEIKSWKRACRMRSFPNNGEI